MGSRRSIERDALLAAPDRRAYLLQHSHLPGPRANLELLDAAGDVLPRGEALAWAGLSPGDAPGGTALEFLPCCGLVALGRLVAEGAEDSIDLVSRLRAAPADERWRVREAVAIALQQWADADPAAMIAAIEPWAEGSPYECRAAVAAICEPRLLSTTQAVQAAVLILDASTTRLAGLPRPRGEAGRVLGAALGYGWSVAVAADAELVL